MERWAHPFQELFNPQEPSEISLDNFTQQFKPEQYEDIKHAIIKLKKHKAAGEDNIVAELIKQVDEYLKLALRILINRI